jgi:hypothetical protein
LVWLVPLTQSIKFEFCKKVFYTGKCEEKKWNLDLAINWVLLLYPTVDEIKEKNA